MMRRMMVVAAVVAALVPGWASAQESRPAEPAASQVVAPVAAPVLPAGGAETAAGRLRPSVLGAELLAPAPARTPADERQPVHTPAYRHQPGLALMIVGGALFLGGAIISGDAGTALMVGGVVVGAVGLYQYLQ